MGGGFLSSLSTPWTPSAPPKQGSSGNTWPFSPLFVAYSNYGRRASTERNSSNAKRNFGTILIRSYKLSIRYTVVQLLRSAEINTGQQLFQTEVKTYLIMVHVWRLKITSSDSFNADFVNSTWSRLRPPQSLLLTSETTCSGGALVNHSYQDPSYTDAPGALHRWAASTMWQAVTPEPQDPQSGFVRSTCDFSKNFFSCSVESIMPSSSRNLKKGMHLEPGMWPGWTPMRQWQSSLPLGKLDVMSSCAPIKIQ